eukprot:CAMPEP_0197639860 /NCGR_PEP_ID=MMETSP1338-20131121/14351_1 /TAXON_ID=43686 ORGANISM="Pelagodinium beii, Strain RCC1491" /NCGR_SAMPLE_ID=MMETSP1338 /ASSEMBLY_ACC=CAM_ASM_000754 /LENGTH=1177 /DNA_ID=CAMNT_0043212641 /DNA_START=33 /DNA_END=3566 /DNA_ORIENTATION=+
MASRLRPRSASLKALPPDSPSGSASGEAPSLAPAELHWTVNAKSKEKAAPSGKRTLKSVSLKLPKGSETSPTSSRSNSAGLPWGSGELFLDARQCARQGLGSGPPSRERGSGSEAIGNAYPVSGGARQPLQPVQPQPSRQNLLDRGQPPSREKLSSTAPAAVGGRPPVPSRPAPGAEGPSASERRRTAGRSAVDSPKSGQPEEDLPSRPGSSYERAASVYASLPATPGRRQTLLQDNDSFIFKPAVEADVTPMPKGMRRINPLLQEAQARAAARRNGLVTKQSKPESSVAASQVLQLQQKAKDLQAQLAQAPLVQEAEDEDDVPAPRIAWSEPTETHKEEDEFDYLDVATQLRRELLSRRLLEEEEEDGEAKPEIEMEEQFQKRTLRSEDAKRSMGELEESLAKAHSKGERDRIELGSYLENLRTRTFQAPPEDSAFLTGPEEEPLVSMPDDFDDVVDINASMAAAERRQGRPSSGEGQRSTSVADKTSAPESKSTSGLRLPSFLEKYFDEEKAAQELPIVQMNLEEARGFKTKDKETDLEKGLRQIARLDNLLATREASGLARVKAAKVELDVTKEKLKRDGEKGEEEKFEVLRKLKEKGMLRSSAPSCAPSSRAPSEPSHSVNHSASQSRLNSARGSATSLVATTPTPVSPTGEMKLVDWSGWACSVEEQKPVISLASLSALVARPASREETPAGSVQSTPRLHGSAEDEQDTTTFNLTAPTADLGSLDSKRAKERRPVASQSSHARALAPVIEDAVPGEDNNAPDSESDAEELELEAPPLELEDDLYAADAYDLDAIRAIDDKLAMLVPEQEWEAKSIRSLPMGSELSSVTGVDQAKGSKSSKARSVWSRKSSDSTLPGEAVLRDQAEERETREALVAIEDKLAELKDVRPDSSPSELKPEDLRKLLLQAATQSALPDAQDKVLALTAKEEDLQKSLQGMMRMPSSSSKALAIPDQSALTEARSVLDRLAENRDDWDTAFTEAKFSLDQLEEGLRSLEELEAPPANVQDDAAIEAAVADVASFASRLEELGREAEEMAGPSKALLQNLSGIDDTTAKGADADTASAITALPRLSGAGGSLEDDDLGDLPAVEGTDLDVDLSEDLPAPLRDPLPAFDPTKALDLNLPSGDGLWDDAELERLARAMDAHYGDVLQLPPDEPDLKLSPDPSDEEKEE